MSQLDPTIEIPRPVVEEREVRAEEPRRHPVAYAAVAVAVLALLLSLAALARSGDGPHRVVSGGRQCVVASAPEGGHGDALYCQS
jgi:hypothetical protein